MTEADYERSEKYSAWEKHNISQLLYFRSLPLRQKMQAIEEMGEIVRRLEEQRRSKRTIRNTQNVDSDIE